MAFKEKKFTNSKVDPQYFFRLGTHFNAFESAIALIKTPFLNDKDFEELKKLTDGISGLLKEPNLVETNLVETNNLLLTTMENFKKEHNDYVSKRSLDRSGIDSSQLTLLRKDMVDSYSKEEIAVLCMDLGINHEDLNGDTLTGKIQDLIEYCRRRKLLPKLVKICEEERPDVLWLDGQNAYKCLKTEEWRNFNFELIKKLNYELQGYSLLYLPNFQPPPSIDEIEDIYKCFHPREQFDALPIAVQSVLQEAINCFACGQYTASVMLTWHATKTTIDEYYHRLYAYLPEAITLKDNSWSSYLLAIPDDDVIKYRVAEIDKKRREAPDYISNHEDAWLSYMRSAFNLCSYLVGKWIELKARLSVEVYSEIKLNSYLDIDHDVFWALILLEMYGGGIGRLKISENQYLSSKIMRIETEVIQTNAANQNTAETKLPTVKQIGEKFTIDGKNHKKILEKATESLNFPLEVYIEHNLKFLPESSSLVKAINKIRLLVRYSKQIHVFESDNNLSDWDSLQMPETYLVTDNK